MRFARHPTVFVLLLAALLLRGLVPLGFMPGQAQGQPGLVLCTPQGYVTVAGDAAPATAKPAQDCVFGLAISMAGLLPTLPALDLPPVAPTVLGTPQTLSLHRSPTTPYPARGPPSPLV